MSERVVLVTGSTDGIGRQVARQLAAAGVHVIVHGRSKPKVEAAVAALRDELPGGTFDGVSFDIGRVSDVKRGVEEVGKLNPTVLVNNAGIFASERAINSDGFEMTFAVNYLGPFLLTHLLLPKLSRVVNVSSIAHTRGAIDFADPSLGAKWTGYAAYAQSKLANVMHAISLAERNDPKTLTAYSLHPGVNATKLLRQGFGPVQGQSPDVGARTITRLAGVEEIEDPSGTYFSEGTATPPASAARDKDARDRLWEMSIRLLRL